MSQLIYWKVANEDAGDEFAYSFRFRTKKEAFAFWDALETYEYDGFFQPVKEMRRCSDGEWWLPPTKVTIQYTGGTFGLLEAIAQENHNDY